MGPHEGWTLPGGPIPNGLLPNEVGSLTRVLDEERWEMAEGRIAELISRIQPNQPSEERRKAVANYVQRLILKCFSCEVFTFGSVPLKTYLPDGDIDLTAFSNNGDLKDTWANEVRDALQDEEKNENAEFHVKEVQYIQAEVKIIKCLVENIVVDISFNQVGGLCTLCFLEEMDSLINQNHLFKRSIILIKAWCYYESRILGAHHGLISTYALETLVLYIFHVFNNQLSGPLEVLYRFLEFFSNFDWENFCVSLWGPVTISSLPHMIAVPPRRDGGDVLLSKPFLDACSSVYAVTPGALENQGQPFVLKHFNVIDPLRTNNNLGRSVSKGNFFRIRSAFTFGAKRLARLLECAKEDVIDEVNQFFMNTWERHGSGNRPDAPVPNFLYVQPQKNVPVEELKNFRATASNKKKNVNHLLHVDHEKLAEGVGDYCHSTSQAPDKLSRHPQDLCRASSPSVHCTHSQKLYGMQINSGVSDQLERSNTSSGSVKSERGQRTSNSNHSVNDSNGKNRSQFVRTQSSPELRDSSGDVLSHIRRNKVVEATKYSKFDYSSKRKNLGSVIGSQSTKASLDDPMSTTSSNPSLKAGSDTNSVSNSYQDDLGFASMREELASVSEALEMQHEMTEEEQDLVNLMASANLHNFNGQVKLPIHMASPDLPVSNLIGSVSHAHRNLAGILPTNMPLIGPPWASSIPFSQGFLSPPMIHYFHTVGPSSDHDGKVKSIDENSSANEPYQEEGDHFQEHDAVLAKGYNSGEENHLIHNFDGKQQSYSSGLSFASLTGDNNSGALGEPKFGMGDGESARGDYSDIFQNQASGGTYDKCNTTSPNLRLSPVTQASSLRRKSSYQSSRNGSTGKISRSSREKWGKKPAKLADPTSLYAKSRRQPECTSEHISAEDDDDTRDCVSISTMGSDMPDRVAGSASVASAHLRRHHVPGYEPTHISGSDSMIPIAPDHLNSSRQRVVDNSGVVPMAFVPTGPPVPFFMLPFGNFASDTGNADGSASQFDRNARLHHHSVNLADHNFDLFDNLDHPDIQSSSTASRTGASESSDEYKSDILNGDLASHRHSLLYGRFCQNTHYHGPFTIMVQPTYLQDQIPLDSPGRPLSGNVNLTQVMGHGQRLVPMMPLQPGSERASGVIQQYGEDAPRYRVGTGTYLPNPKVQSSMRNYRGNFNGDRSDRGDKEGSWTNPKQRVTGRSHGRNQADRPNNLRLNRLTGAENQADKQWQSYRNEPHRREPRASYPVQYSSFGPISSTHSPVNNSYGMYPPAPTSSNGVGPPGPAGPPVIMVYPFDQGLKDVRRPDGEILVNGVYEQRYGSYQGGSSRSSPDQPSSPQIRR